LDPDLYTEKEKKQVAQWAVIEVPGTSQ